MKIIVYIAACFSCLVLSGCISEYEAKGIDEMKDILVVEGIITEGESVITLSRSLNLTSNDPPYSQFINNAVVYVECDDGTKFYASSNTGSTNGQYKISTGNLNPEKQYRLRIEIEEPDTNNGDCVVENGIPTHCPVKTFVYGSPYSNPIITPEIDSVFWTKNATGQPVKIHVATHDPLNRALYYQWSFFEEWEIRSDIDSNQSPITDKPPFIYPYRCWNSYKSTEILLGSGEKTVFGQMTQVLTEISPSNRKLEVMYRTTVKQNVISKRAFDYFENIKKNATESGDLFSPTPSELRGNITCITDPNKPVIGYVDISTTTQKQFYITPYARVYERVNRNWEFECDENYSEPELIAMYDPDLPPINLLWVPYYWDIPLFDPPILLYVITYCIDCTNFGHTIRPDSWPD
jgi:hypothetical protein